MSEPRTRKIKHLLYLVLLIFVCQPVLSSQSEQAPIFHIEKSNFCPFRCCNYGEWSVDQETPGYEKPDEKSKIVGHFQEGNVVKALRGEVHAIPGKYAITKTPGKNHLSDIDTNKKSKKISKGDVLYLYIFYGEGVHKIWHKGEFTKSDILDFQGKHITEASNTMWVYIKSPLGWSGWTRETQNFQGADICYEPYNWQVRVHYKTKHNKIRSPAELKTYNDLYSRINSIANIANGGYSEPVTGNMYMDIHTRSVLADYSDYEEALYILATSIRRFATELEIEGSVTIKVIRPD